MAIGKAKASAEAGSGFKMYMGVGSFRVLGVNPTKEELSAFYGRDVQSDPTYVNKKTDKDGKPYTQTRISFMIQADPSENKNGKDANKDLAEPLKTTINFFVDSRYRYNSDQTKVQVIDKYGRTAWVTVDQAKNKQIPVYSNGPAKLDKDYHPCHTGEEELVKFIINYLNITPIESYNRNTGTWMPASNPEDCELDYHFAEYLKGNVSELKEMCTLIPTNKLKLLMGVRTDNEGKQFNTVYTRVTLRNGSQSYNAFKDDIESSKNAGGLADTVFSDDAAGAITNIHVYKENVQETNLSKPATEDPFASKANDLPFGEEAANDDPFAGVA